jgi:hypothetical protein
MDGRLGPGSNLEWQSANRGSQGQLQPQQQSRWDERGSYRQTVGQPTQQPYSGGSRYPGGQGNELAQQRGGGAQGQWRQPSGPRDEYGESYRNGSQSGNQRYQDGQSQPRYDRGPTGGNSQANGENKPGGTVPGAADGKRPITFQCYTSRENGPGSGNGGVTMQCYIP